MRYLYSLVIYLLRPLAFGVLLWRSVRNPAYRIRLSERFGLGARLPAAQSVWVHAVSLGEVSAAAPLIRALRVRHPDTAVMLTTATPTGRMRAEALFGASITVRYVPYDTPGSMRRFLRLTQPRLVIIMETELWPNLFHQCRRQCIPVILANARLSSKSVARYLKFGSLFRDVFAGNTLVAAQSAEDAERFVSIGARRERLQVIGNLKFDVDVDPALRERGCELRATCWPGRPTWIAGSTHPGEEELVLTAHSQLQLAVPNALLLVVPRHPQRFQAVADLLTRRGYRFERRSSNNLLRPDVAVLLVDTVGELANLYAAVDVAFVGGSLVPVGGHNLLEPAALGIPVITGPHQSNAQEIATLLLKAGAALQVGDAAQLAQALQRLLSDAATRARVGAHALQVMRVNRGSVTRLLELISPWLDSAGGPRWDAPRPVG